MEDDTQLSVFENGADNGAEQDRSRALLIVGAIAVLVMAALITMLVMTKPESVKEVENMVRAGSPEFETYKNKVELEVDPNDKIVHPNMMGMWQLEVRARLHNRGDRPLIGVEVLGKMYDLEDKIIAQARSLPIPRVRKDPLNPGESMRISVKVDAPGNVTEAEVKDMLLELNGLRFQ